LRGKDGFVALTVINSSAENGSATVAPQLIKGTTRVTVTGGAQNMPGHGGQLAIQAGFNGRIVATSPGFGVCAHPSGLTETLFQDLDDPKKGNFGIIVRIFTDSDSGKEADLDQVQTSEIVQQFHWDDPPFPQGSGRFSGAGTVAGQVSDLDFSPVIAPPGKYKGDTHAQARPSPGPKGNVEFVQVHVFKCARCGMPPKALPKSGFDIKYEVFWSKAGQKWQYKISKIGTEIGNSVGKESFKAKGGTTNPTAGIVVTHDLP